MARSRKTDHFMRHWWKRPQERDPENCGVDGGQCGPLPQDLVWVVRIDGPLMGAVRTTRRQMFKDPRYAKYDEFKKKLRRAADAVGMPHDLGKREAYKVEIVACWKRRARADLDNIAKSCLDGFWRNDRRVLELKCKSIEFSDAERMTVFVARLPLDSVKSSGH